MVTMKKIAELCGVSRGTVDRALNGRGRVNAETAENIRKMAKQLGYEPNPAGKALAARKRRPVIGIILSSEGNAFFDRVIDGIKDAAEEYKIYGLQVEIHTMKGYLPEDQLARIESIQADVNALILNPINDKYLNVPKPAVRKKTVVQSGRLVDFKNQPMLIEASLKVHEKHPDYDLKIYGGDSFDGTKEILEKLIQEHHAESYITLMGASDSLEKQLPEASVYAFSSDWEGLPNALLEAMALGMPIVATDCPCGGPRTVMTNEVDGLLVPIKDPEAMAQGICRLIEDRELAERLGENARKISEKANGKAIIEQWRDYIETVLRDAKE